MGQSTNACRSPWPLTLDKIFLRGGEVDARGVRREKTICMHHGLRPGCVSALLCLSTRVMAPRPILLSPEAVAKHGIHIGKNEAAFRENSATIVMPSKQAAFLNPVQEFNRDLSTLAIITWSELLNDEKRQRFETRVRARSKKRTERLEHDAKRAKTGTYSRSTAHHR